MTDTEQLEIRYAELERMVEEMNDVLQQQWKEIDRLKLDNERLKGRLLSLEESGAGGPKPFDPFTDRPPHY